MHGSWQKDSNLSKVALSFASLLQSYLCHPDEHIRKQLVQGAASQFFIPVPRTAGHDTRDHDVGETAVKEMCSRTHQKDLEKKSGVRHARL